MRLASTSPALASIALLAATTAQAQDAKFLRSLRKIEPITRLEQICDLEAMNRIKRETGMKADRAKSDVISSPHHNSHTLTANVAHFEPAQNGLSCLSSAPGRPTTCA